MKRREKVFILKLWCDSQDSASEFWRGSLKELHSKEQITFATLDKLSTYLKEWQLQDSSNAPIKVK